MRSTCAVPSLNGGRNSVPRVPSTAIAAMAVASTTIPICRGNRHERAMKRPPTAFTPRTTGPSPVLAVAFAFGSSHQHSTGVTVIDTSSDARMLTTYAMPIGAKSRPSMPVSANSGAYTTTTSSVPTRMGFRTSLDAR